MSGGGAGGHEDVFDTAQLRARVLDAWAASTARFREDANAEEDLALGAYRDRLVVELAQNAADAAARAGVSPGRLLLRLTPDALVAANTGEPLDAAGVEALSTLRASAKRSVGSDVVGRFGVGFAAVLTVTDEPAVLSTSGAVRWSAGGARDLLHEAARSNPGLADELARRAGALPVLRLPYAGTGEPPAGFDTAVVLPFRDAKALGIARTALAGLDAALLLTLPALGEVEVRVDLPDEQSHRVLRARREGQVVDLADGGEVTRWRLSTASGSLEPALLADRPTEERVRRSWTVTVAVPVGEHGHPGPLPPSVPAVVHAPTPTDEPLGLPVLLVASFPLDPTRRHVVRGPLRDLIVTECADAYATLVTALPSHPSVLTLVPGPLPAGELDGLVREAVRRRLVGTPFLPAADEPDESGRHLLRPRDAVMLGPEARGAAAPDRLSPVVAGLVAAEWWRGHDRSAALTALGVRQLGLADLVDGLAGLTLSPPQWRDLYAALDGADPDALGALPVPIADGRLVRGPRGLLVVPDPDEHLAALGLRVAHAEATHPLLERLGAVPATPRAVLDDPAVHAAVAASYDEDDPGPVAEAVLSLVAAAGVAAGEQPWLTDLALRGDDGEWYPAGEMVFPGGPLASIVAPEAPFGVVAADVLTRWGADVLAAVGVLDTYALVRDQDVPLDPDACEHDLDLEDEWVDEVSAALPASEAPAVMPELLAVRDLELTDPARWDQALSQLARPPLREAVTAPTQVLLPDGGTVPVRPYTAWWLGRHPVLGGHRPSDLHAGSDPRLSGLYRQAPSELDQEFLQALGVRRDLESLLADPGGADDLLRRLADATSPVGRTQLRALYAALARLPAGRVSPPDRVRALRGEDVVVTAPPDVVVVDAPDLLPLVRDRPRVVGPAGTAANLADLLDVPLASEVVPGRVESDGTPRQVPAEVRAVLMRVTGSLAHDASTPASYVAHDRLVVDGAEVGWRVAHGVVHASGPDGLARGLAWASGSWPRRHLVEAVLRAPGRVGDLLTEAELDDET